MNPKKLYFEIRMKRVCVYAFNVVITEVSDIIVTGQEAAA